MTIFQNEACTENEDLRYDMQALDIIHLAGQLFVFTGTDIEGSFRSAEAFHAFADKYRTDYVRKKKEEKQRES